MAIYRKGSDPVALRACAERLTTHARTCDAARSDAGRAVRSLRGHWGGGDLERLVSDWSLVDASLAELADRLDSLSAAVRRNADGQDRTSVAGAGAAVGAAATLGAAAATTALGAAGDRPPGSRGSRAEEGAGAGADRNATTVDRRGSGGDGSDSTTGGAPLPGGLGDPVPGTTLPAVPQPPEWHAADEGAGAYDSEWAGPRDYATKWAAEAGAHAAGEAWPDASRNLLHYLGNSGDPLTQDVDGMLSDCAALRGDVDAQVDGLARDAVDRARAGGATGPVTFPVDTAWTGHYIGPQESSNWYYASGGMSYNQTGSVTVYPPDHPGGPWRYETSTQVNYRDQYNWDGGKSTQIGPLTVTDAELAALHRAGIAREYTMDGASSVRTTKGEVS